MSNYFLHHGIYCFPPLPPRASLRVGLSLHLRRRFFLSDLFFSDRGVVIIGAIIVCNLFVIFRTSGVAAVPTTPVLPILNFGGLTYFLVVQFAMTSNATRLGLLLGNAITSPAL